MTDSEGTGDGGTTPALDVSREEFRALVADGRTTDAGRETGVVVRAEAPLPVDVDPLPAYAALTGRTTDATGASHTFLLESAEKVASSDPDGAFTPDRGGADRHARYSFVGYDPAARVTVHPSGEDRVEVETLDGRYADLVNPGTGDTLDTLRAALPDVARRGFDGVHRQRLDGGLVGFLSYDAVYDLHLHEVGVERPESRFPDAEFVLTTQTVVFDDERGAVSLAFTPVVRPGDDPDVVYDDLLAEAERVAGLLSGVRTPSPGGFVRAGERSGPQDAYEDAVATANEHVLDGDIYQGVVSRTRELYGDIDPLGLYRALREVNPSPYMYLLDHGDLTVVGASPETLVSVRGETVTSNPIAGTCDRGTSPVEDRRLAGEMLADGKERAEHTMLVDLARNDVRRVSEAGSVRVEEFMNVLKYSHVQHIESTVTGRLADDADAFDATRASFPAGTLSGAPKMRAMEIIDDLERRPRGPYGGGVGYVSWDGDADMAIVIRTATVEAGAGPDASDLVTVQAGAGIVADSDPTAEYEETENKMRGVLAAIERIEVEDGAGPADAGEPEVSR
ncbi:anthranilate synthase component I [Haloglomus irregulare]|jgi:anthranilate synthase component 1|uniref:Anthranilate synthase component 1 n=1 Tax=Haloglomus irregulare TaxID=2234134 RepID=A0A554NCH3_9EURY|nr:anthranilate synthase component I [Haloglomus irregulare]TSD15083.1 anthranilate synthase component I [Haloglomus irregulare]